MVACLLVLLIAHCVPCYGADKARASRARASILQQAREMSENVTYHLGVEPGVEANAVEVVVAFDAQDHVATVLKKQSKPESRTWNFVRSVAMAETLQKYVAVPAGVQLASLRVEPALVRWLTHQRVAVTCGESIDNDQRFGPYNSATTSKVVHALFSAGVTKAALKDFCQDYTEKHPHDAVSTWLSSDEESFKEQAAGCQCVIL